jgi:hypothetical protein
MDRREKPLSIARQNAEFILGVVLAYEGCALRPSRRRPATGCADAAGNKSANAAMDRKTTMV